MIFSLVVILNVVRDQTPLKNEGRQHQPVPSYLMPLKRSDWSQRVELLSKNPFEIRVALSL